MPLLSVPSSKRLLLDERVALVLRRAERTPHGTHFFMGRAGLCDELSPIPGQCGYLGQVIYGYVRLPGERWFYHSWHEFPDGTIWDLSAGQFNCCGLSAPEEYLGPPPPHYVRSPLGGKMWLPTTEQHEDYWLRQHVGEVSAHVL